MDTDWQEPLELDAALLDTIFGGVSAFGGEGKSVLPLTPKCPYFTPGPNNYNGFALEDTCGQCARFRFGSIGKCAAETGGK